jgi:DNA polymerase zeta
LDEPWEFAGLVYHLQGGVGSNVLDDWEYRYAQSVWISDLAEKLIVHGWEYAKTPPSKRSIKLWLLTTEAKKRLRKERAKRRSQASFVSLSHSFGN